MLNSGENQYWSQAGVVSGAAGDYDLFGYSLVAGDFNGDGYADLVTGVPGEDVYLPFSRAFVQDAGQVNVLYGSRQGLTSTGQQSFNGTNFNSSGDIYEPEKGRFGESLAVGDINGDGFEDLIVGAPDRTLNGKKKVGAVNIIFGSANGLTTTGAQTWSQDSEGILDEAESEESQFGIFSDRFGAAVASGDFNNDGYADILVGAPDEDVDGVTNAGAVNVIYGSADGLTSENNQFWTQNSENIKEKAEEYDRLGAALATGDFNGDGYDDAAFGAPGETVEGKIRAGAVHILYGSETGLESTTNQLWTQKNTGGKEVTPGLFDNFGETLATGDFNGDGYSDLAIGVPGETVNGIADAGSVQILYGSAEGLTRKGNKVLIQQIGQEIDPEAFDWFGDSLSVGDFNNDGYQDLSVGVSQESVDGISKAGGVNIFLGSEKGLTPRQGQFWSQNSEGIKGISESNDSFGKALAGADFDGDGSDDLAIGTPYEEEDINRINTGGVNVLYSNTIQNFDLNFEAINQSMWSSGSSLGIKDKRFWGVDWNESGSASRLGFGIKGSTNGRIGLESNLQVNSGSVNASLPIDFQLTLPDEIKPGQTITIGSSYTLEDNAKFSTISPRAFYSLDLIFNMGAKLEVDHPFGDFDIFNAKINANQNLVELSERNPNFKLPESKLKGLGSIEVRTPTINTKGDFLGNNASSTGQDQVVNAELDLDRLATTLLQHVGVPVPHLGDSFSVAGDRIKGSYDIIDVDLRAELLAKQTFDLSVDELTGQLILENGDTVDFIAGQDITYTVPEDYDFGETLEVDALLNMGANLRNQTGLAYNVDLVLDVLSASGRAKIPVPIVSDPTISIGFGPVYQKNVDLFDGDLFNLYDQTFALGGLNSQALSFSLDMADA